MPSPFAVCRCRVPADTRRCLSFSARQRTDPAAAARNVHSLFFFHKYPFRILSPGLPQKRTTRRQCFCVGQTKKKVSHHQMGISFWDSFRFVVCGKKVDDPMREKKRERAFQFLVFTHSGKKNTRGRVSNESEPSAFFFHSEKDPRQGPTVMLAARKNATPSAGTDAVTKSKQKRMVFG